MAGWSKPMTVIPAPTFQLGWTCDPVLAKETNDRGAPWLGRHGFLESLLFPI